MIDEAPSIPSLGASTPKGAAMLKGDTKYIALSAIALRPGRMRSGFVRLPPVVFGIEKINGLVAASASDRLATVIVRLTMKLGAPFENLEAKKFSCNAHPVSNMNSLVVRCRIELMRPPLSSTFVLIARPASFVKRLSVFDVG
jgi:hypothetical protein